MRAEQLSERGGGWEEGSLNDQGKGEFCRDFSFPDDKNREEVEGVDETI